METGASLCQRRVMPHRLDARRDWQQHGSPPSLSSASPSPCSPTAPCVSPLLTTPKLHGVRHPRPPLLTRNATVAERPVGWGLPADLHSPVLGRAVGVDPPHAGGFASRRCPWPLAPLLTPKSWGGFS